MSDCVANRCRAIFDQDDETGEDVTHILNKQTRKKTKLWRVGSVWILDGSASQDFLVDSTSDVKTLLDKKDNTGQESAELIDSGEPEADPAEAGVFWRSSSRGSSSRG